MKQLLAIILFFQILIGGVLPVHDQDEIKGIPGLVKHYYQHLSESDGKISVTEFLQLHYKAGSKHQDKSHDALPSYHWHEIHHLISFKFQVPQLFPDQVISVITPDGFYWENFYSFLPYNTLVDPPNNLHSFVSC